MSIIPAAMRTIPAQLNGSIFRPIAPSKSITPPVVPRMKPPGVMTSKNIAIIPPESSRYAISGLDTNWIMRSVNDMPTREITTSSSRFRGAVVFPTLILRPRNALISEFMSCAIMSIAPAFRASVAVREMLSSIIFSAIS